MGDAAVIGRFQPFHAGHAYLLARAAHDHDDRYIGIGIAGDERTFHDPLTFQERESILSERYPDATVFGIEDRGDDAAWMDAVQQYVPDDVTAVTGNPDTARCFRDAGYAVDRYDEDDMLDRDTYSGTRIRDRAAAGDPWRHLVPADVRRTLDEDIWFEPLMQEL